MFGIGFPVCLFVFVFRETVLQCHTSVFKTMLMLLLEIRLDFGPHQIDRGNSREEKKLNVTFLFHNQKSF